MRIAVTGASGLIGSHLVPALRADGHDVVRLVRRAPRSPEEAEWDPTAGTVDVGALTGTDAVIHLAGIGAGDKRWTSSYKKEILSSRVDGTRTISMAIAAMPVKPAVLLSSSAIGWYGDTGDRALDEDDPTGPGYFADVVRQWEEATAPAAEAGVRVVTMRTGVVIAPDGGLLVRAAPVPVVKVSLLQLFRLGLGGTLGSGRQWLSWIGIDDTVNAMRFLLTSDLSGPVNLTAPQPVTNKEFTRALARGVHRPANAHVPAIALRAGVGEFAGEILGGQNVLPRRLLDAGFTFSQSTIDQGIAAALRG
ncbi:MAG: hypothetical protein JWM93_316 [Frankiales bacterium]|nr:hypothetical protein [Frankiales bacterium]